MSEFYIVLKDKDGFEICSDVVEGKAAAKQRARYMLSPNHAAMIGTSHEDLGTFKVEVQAMGSGECLWDAFL